MAIHERINHREQSLCLRGFVAATAACAIALAASAVMSTAARADQQKAATASNDHDDAFTIKPDTIAFGKRPLFTSHSESFWLKNKDKTPLHITKVELQGANEGVFKIDQNCGASIAVGGECRINVSFEPTSAGEKTATLRVMTKNQELRTKTVTGTGVQAEFSVSTNTLAFGKVERNSGGKEQKVTIRNTGTVALPITATSLGGPNEHQFSQSNDCPKELPVGKACTSTVIFRPTDQGQKTATLTVWAKGGAAEKKVSITGTGA